MTFSRPSGPGCGTKQQSDERHDARMRSRDIVPPSSADPLKRSIPHPDRASGFWGRALRRGCYHISMRRDLPAVASTLSASDQGGWDGEHPGGPGSKSPRGLFPDPRRRLAGRPSRSLSSCRGDPHRRGGAEQLPQPGDGDHPRRCHPGSHGHHTDRVEFLRSRFRLLQGRYDAREPIPGLPEHDLQSQPAHRSAGGFGRGLESRRWVHHLHLGQHQLAGVYRDLLHQAGAVELSASLRAFSHSDADACAGDRELPPERFADRQHAHPFRNPHRHAGPDVHAHSSAHGDSGGDPRCVRAELRFRARYADRPGRQIPA